MLINQLFAKERQPTRPLNEVVNAEGDIDVRSEIDEYVFTEHTLGYLRSLIEGILDTSQGQVPETLCGWIAGFFGSGKSHFLKLSGALLENRALEVDGRRIPALEYLATHRDVKLPWERLAKEFHVKSVTVNLALAHGGGRQAQEKPLLFRLASEINRKWGFSSVPHVASIEREIQRAGKWDAFLTRVREYTEGVDDRDAEGVPLEWTNPDIRDKASDAHRVLEEVLPDVLPKISKVQAFLKAREDEEQPSPDTVVRLAVDFASSLNKDLGRVLLCVDEVALYLRGGDDRVREVQGLAELVKSKGRGKVFLFATAQLKVDTIDASLASLSGPVVFLRDRFPKGGRLELEERDIDLVVRERWLQKEPKSPHLVTLEGLVREHGGRLAHAAKLREEILIGDVDALTDPTAIVAYYPFLPYHVRLMQLILSALRQETQIDQTAAQSRALLTSVRSLFLVQNGGGLADSANGTLVTFDKVYDVIRDVVRKTDSTTDRWIVEEIDRLPSPGSVKLSSVAKVIFLLQHLNPKGARRIRVGPENVAALLYPSLGAPWEPHLKNVRQACALLKDNHYVDEEPDAGLRFYRSDEKVFRDVVQRQPVDPKSVGEVLRATIEREAAELGLKAHMARPGHRLDVGITVHFGGMSLPDPRTMTGARELELHLVWPADSKAVDPIPGWKARYAGTPHIVVWALAANPDVEPLARESLKLEGAIEEYERLHGPDVAELLRGERLKLKAMREGDLPRALRTAIEQGIVVHGGAALDLAGSTRKPLDAFRDTMNAVVDQVFTEIDAGCVSVDDSTLRKVLTWQPGQAQPDAFQKLKLFDASGHPLVDRAFLKELVLGLRGRSEADRTGRAFLERFRAAPFGWPENAVKAGLGALLRGRRLLVRLADGTPIRTVNDRTEAWLTGTQLFNKAVLGLTDLQLGADEVKLLDKLFLRAFDRPGLDTIEKLEKRVHADVTAQLADAREALADLHGRQLPGVEEVEALRDLLMRVEDVDIDAGKLKTFCDELAALTGEDIARVRQDDRWAALFKLPAADRDARLESALSVIEKQAKLVRTVALLRRSDKLAAIAGARTRARTVYAPWRAGRGAGSAPPPELALLEEQVASEDLISRADQALDRDARCFNVYASEYRTRHGERHAVATRALAGLAAHVAWTRLAEPERMEIRKGFGGCAAIADLALVAAPDGCCSACKATFAELAKETQMMTLLEREAFRRLDALASGQTATATPTEAARVIGITKGSMSTHVAVRVASDADLPRLFAAITDHARTVVFPCVVRVRFDDDDGSGTRPAGD